MNRVAFLFICMVALAAGFAGQADTSPLSRAIELLGSLAAKIRAEGEAAEKAWSEYEAWCSTATSDLTFQIKTGQAKKEQLEASITKAAADISASDEKIESLADSISSDNQELQEASAVRAKESADFKASEAELVDAIETIDRAVAILQKEMRKNPAAFAQVDASNANNLLKSLEAVIDAAAFTASDQKKLAALVQERQSSADDDELGAPSTGAYKTHSTNIFDMLEDLKEKAEGQLSDLRKAEASTKHNFQMLHQSLTNQIDVDQKDLDGEKAAKAATQEAKSVAEGDLAEATMGLKNDQKALSTTSEDCVTAAHDHDATLVARNAELEALATASEVLSETSSGAAGRTYSFLQVISQSQVGSKLHSRADLANAEIVHLLKKLAKDNHSAALAQLASRIAATLHYGASAGQDPFVKVKQLITDLLNKLQAEAQSDLTEKSYCDEELASSGSKQDEIDSTMAKLSTKIDQATASSAQLKADVKELQADLAKLARSQAEMDAMRQEGRAEYMAAKSDLELGLQGVRKAVGVLRDYYAGSAGASSMLQGGTSLSAMMHQPVMPDTHVKSGEAGQKIIEILEQVESDFAKDLATEETAEADAKSEYEKMTDSNKNTKTIKEQDVKYKTREFKGQDKALSDLGGDKSTTQSELDAVNEYRAKLKERCIAKPETYATRKARRESEIQGLREALSILENEGVFVQRKKKHGLRGLQ